MNKTTVIITLFSSDKILLDEDITTRVLEGDYPTRVKSKILATIRELVSASDRECIVGFLPIQRERQDVGSPVNIDVSQDHYGELALYLAPEVSCSIVSDLLSIGMDGQYSCRNELVSGNNIIIISDKSSNWDELNSCLEKAGAESIKYISILG